MNLFYKIQDKELVRLRNDVFKNRGIPSITKNGFLKSPYSTSWFGKDESGSYIYEFCRLSGESHLEFLLVYINKGDRWVQFHLNIFKLSPPIINIEQLYGLNGMQFHLPPNSVTLTRLSTADGLVFAGAPKHKIRFYLTKAGLEKRLNELGDIIERDMENIDVFVKSWVSEHKPLVTDWEGHLLKG